jgi:hypothetical protein
LQPTEVKFVSFVPGQVHDGHDRAVDHAARLGNLWTPEVEVFQLKLFYLAESISTIQLYKIYEAYKNIQSVKTSIKAKTDISPE